MKEKDAVKIIEILKKTYPDAKCSLDFTTPFEMLVAVCLSAQCTDDRVNKVTPELFKKMNKPEDFANADIKEIENLIHSCGFYRKDRHYPYILLFQYTHLFPRDPIDRRIRLYP